MNLEWIDTRITPFPPKLTDRLCERTSCLVVTLDEGVVQRWWEHDHQHWDDETGSIYPGTDVDDVLYWMLTPEAPEL